MFSFRSGKKLLIQQQELEKRTREYNDYHNQLIQEKQLNLSPDNSLKNGGDKYSSGLHDQNHTSAPTTISRNASFVQSSGKSRLEITSREVSVNTSNNLISVKYVKSKVNLLNNNLDFANPFLGKREIGVGGCFEDLLGR